MVETDRSAGAMGRVFARSSDWDPYRGCGGCDIPVPRVQASIGESLIFLGERFGATPHSETASRAPTSASSQAAGPTSQRHATVSAPGPAATQPLGSGEALIQPETKAAKPAPAKLAPKPIAPAISFAPSTAAVPLIDFAAARPVLPHRGRAGLRNLNPPIAPPTRPPSWQ